jgi:hypothetical protein
VTFFSTFWRRSAVGLVSQQGQKCGQHRPAVAEQVDLHRVAQAQHASGDIDLHAARLALLRQEFRIGKAGPDHQQRVAFLHHVPARLCAEKTDRTGDPRQIVRDSGLAEQRLGDAGTEFLGRLYHHIGRMERAGTDQHRNLAASIQHIGGTTQLCFVGQQVRHRCRSARYRACVAASPPRALPADRWAG